MNLSSLMSILIKFMIFFVLFMLFLEMIFFFMLNKKKTNVIKGIKLNLFGLLMEIDNFMMLALSVLILRFLFIIWSLFDSSAIGFVHISLLLIFSVLYGVFTKSIKNVVFETLSAYAIYYSLISSRLLTSYLVEVRYEWYVSLGDILLKIFVILYTTFFLLRNINSAVIRTKHVRRNRHADS